MKINKIEEAKKYKTAEEFVEDQEGPVYHGSDVKINKFDKQFLSKKSGFGSSGLGFYFSSKEIAETFGKNVGEFFVDLRNPKIIPSSEFQEMMFGEQERIDRIEELKNLIENDSDKNIYIENNNLLYTDDETGQEEYLDFDELSKEGKEYFNEISTLLNKDAREFEKLSFDDAKELRKELIGEGYDGIIVDSGDFSGVDFEQAPELYEDNIIAFYPEQIKTKSQLTDIWKKAQAPEKAVAERC